jgi:hypothetical protein
MRKSGVARLAISDVSQDRTRKAMVKMISLPLNTLFHPFELEYNVVHLGKLEILSVLPEPSLKGDM